MVCYVNKKITHVQIKTVNSRVHLRIVSVLLNSHFPVCFTRTNVILLPKHHYSCLESVMKLSTNSVSCKCAHFHHVHTHVCVYMGTHACVCVCIFVCVYFHMCTNVCGSQRSISSVLAQNLTALFLR